MSCLAPRPPAHLMRQAASMLCSPAPFPRHAFPGNLHYSIIAGKERLRAGRDKECVARQGPGRKRLDLPNTIAVLGRCFGHGPFGCYFFLPPLLLIPFPCSHSRRYKPCPTCLHRPHQATTSSSAMLAHALPGRHHQGGATHAAPIKPAILGGAPDSRAPTGRDTLPLSQAPAAAQAGQLSLSTHVQAQGTKTLPAPAATAAAAVTVEMSG